jgi:enoyl-CoA hydratase
MSAPTISRTSHGRVTVLSLNRPDRLNAVNDKLYHALYTTLIDLDAEPNVRALVLTGNGPAFCVGADLKAHREGTRNRCLSPSSRRHCDRA